MRFDPSYQEERRKKWVPYLIGYFLYGDSGMSLECNGLGKIFSLSLTSHLFLTVSWGSLPDLPLPVLPHY